MSLPCALEGYNLRMGFPTSKAVSTAILVLSSWACSLGQTNALPADTPVDGTLKPASSKGRWGYVNGAGLFVVQAKYFAVQPFREGFALVVTEKSWQPLGAETGEFRLSRITYIDPSGREIRPPLSVRRAASFADGLALVVPDSALRTRGGCAQGGYLNAKGDWAIKPQFDDLRDFSEGLAAVNLGAKCAIGGKWGYIDKEGQVTIPMKFIFAGAFHDGRACVEEEPGKDEVIDRKGEIIRGEKCR